MELFKFTEESLDRMQEVKKKQAFLIAKFDGQVFYQAKNSVGTDLDFGKFLFRAVLNYSVQLLTEKGINNLSGALWEIDKQYKRAIEELKKGEANEFN